MVIHNVFISGIILFAPPVLLFLLHDAIQLAKRIKKEILAEENITCSVGIGPNKLVAKIAAGTQKPDWRS